MVKHDVFVFVDTSLVTVLLITAYPVKGILRMSADKATMLSAYITNLPCVGVTWQRFLQGLKQPSTEAQGHGRDPNGQAQQLRCSSSMELLVNVYNNALMGWEPLLEPWRVAVDMTG